MNEFVGLKHIVQIHLGAHLCPLHMVHGVITHTVTAAQEFFKKFGMALHIIAYAKKGGFHAIAVERVEHPRRDLGNGTVVKREIDSLFLSVHAPQGVWIKPTQENCGLLDNHAVGLKGVFYKLWNKERSKENAYVLVAESF